MDLMFHTIESEHYAHTYSDGNNLLVIVVVILGTHMWVLPVTYFTDFFFSVSPFSIYYYSVSFFTRSCTLTI